MNHDTLVFLYTLEKHLQRNYVSAADLAPPDVIERIAKFAVARDRGTIGWAEFVARHEAAKYE